MLNAIRKKKAKLPVFRTTISSSGMISAVSTSACPELFWASLRVFMTKTSSHSGKRMFQLWLRHLKILHHRLVFFKLFLSCLFVRQVELIQQAVKITAADAQFYGSPQAVSRMDSQGRAHQLFLEALDRFVEGPARCIVADYRHSPQFLGQIRDPKILVSAGQYNAAFDHVLQFTDVSRPRKARH